MIAADITLTEGPAAELARALGGQRTGHGWTARCPAHDDRAPSLSISSGTGGRILLTCFAGCSWAAIRDVLQAGSLWPMRQPHSCPATPNRGSSSGPRLLQVGLDGLAIVKRIWRAATAAPGTLVDTYLQSRSITPPVPPTLHYGRLRHRESGRTLPWIVAAVQAADGRLSGLHRTFPRLDGGGKADVEPVKKMLDACRGSVVRLAPAGRRLVLCEGIETGLSIRQVCPDLPVWCALSAGNLDRLQLPAEVEEVVLVADGNPVGLAAAQRAARHYSASGRRIRMVKLPPGMDANDILCLGVAAA